MTNQDYMDLLERFSTGESTIRMNMEYGLVNKTNKVKVLRYFVSTTVFTYDSKDIYNPAPADCNVIEIMNDELIMLMPNIMDAYIAQNHTSMEIQDLYRINSIMKGNGGGIPNQHSMSQVRIPYYPDEAERFQRELMGEFVLYESHLKYVHKIVQDAHDDYKMKMNEIWDKTIIL